MSFKCVCLSAAPSCLCSFALASFISINRIRLGREVVKQADIAPRLSRAGHEDNHVIRLDITWSMAYSSIEVC